MDRHYGKYFAYFDVALTVIPIAAIGWYYNQSIAIIIAWMVIIIFLSIFIHMAFGVNTRLVGAFTRTINHIL